MVTQIRRARLADHADLTRLDAATWSTTVTPAPTPEADAAFFDDRRRPDDVLVADVAGGVAGYAIVGQVVPIPSHEHVLELRGLTVHPACQGRGVGRLLVEAAVEEARARGAEKLSLRVLGPNVAARKLYARCGFEVEGVLRAEFLLDGAYVDDVLMARRLAGV